MCFARLHRFAVTFLRVIGKNVRALIFSDRYRMQSHISCSCGRLVSRSRNPCERKSTPVRPKKGVCTSVLTFRLGGRTCHHCRASVGRLHLSPDQLANFRVLVGCDLRSWEHPSDFLHWWPTGKASQTRESIHRSVTNCGDQVLRADPDFH